MRQNITMKTLDLPSATLIQAGRTMRSDTGGAARAEI